MVFMLGGGFNVSGNFKYIKMTANFEALVKQVVAAVLIRTYVDLESKKGDSTVYLQDNVSTEVDKFCWSFENSDKLRFVEASGYGQYVEDHWGEGAKLNDIILSHFYQCLEYLVYQDPAISKIQEMLDEEITYLEILNEIKTLHTGVIRPIYPESRTSIYVVLPEITEKSWEMVTEGFFGLVKNQIINLHNGSWKILTSNYKDTNSNAIVLDKMPSRSIRVYPLGYTTSKDSISMKAEEGQAIYNVYVMSAYPEVAAKEIFSRQIRLDETGYNLNPQFWIENDGQVLVRNWSDEREVVFKIANKANAFSTLSDELRAKKEKVA